MKKITILYVILLLLSSCQKEDAETNNQPQGKRLSISSYNVGFDQRGWLIFEDYQHVRNVVENLDQEDDQYFLEFEDCLSQITEETSYEDELQIVEQCGIEDQAVYKGFENNFSGYTSLRHIYSQAEEGWLDQQTGDSIDFSTYPEHYISAPGLSSLYNEYGEVQIGDIVYMTKEDGKQIGFFSSELEEVNIDELRTLFHSESFDIANYNHDNITDPDIINQFLYGGEKLFTGGTKPPGAITVSVGVAVGAFVVNAMADAVTWLNDGNNVGDCYYDKNAYAKWRNADGDRELRAELKFRQIIGVGQYAYIRLRYYRDSRIGWVYKRARLKVIQDCPFIKPNSLDNMVCKDGYDDIKSDNDENNNWYSVKENKYISPYHKSIIHPGYMRGRFYKSGVLYLDFYIQ